MQDLGFHFEQESRVEVVVFGLGQLVAREAPDRLQIVPQCKHLHVDDVALGPVQAPRTAIALDRAIVGEADVLRKSQIFFGLGRGDPTVPASCGSFGSFGSSNSGLSQ